MHCVHCVHYVHFVHYTQWSSSGSPIAACCVAFSPQPSASLAFSAAFPGARVVNPVGREMLDTKVNYCLGADHGKWRSGVPTFGVVVYEGLYDGIDLHTYGRRSNLKYEFHVAPGADWRKIRIHYDGIAGLSIAENGSLIVDVGYGWGSLQDDAPIIYQEIGGRRVNVPGRFVLVDSRTYSFEITGTADTAAPLVIDPELAWSTYQRPFCFLLENSVCPR